MVRSKVSPIESVKSALVYLAGQCDGAVEQDGVGFSGADSFKGKGWAWRVNEGCFISSHQMIQAAEMLQKYRKQLERGEIELPTVEEVQDALDRSAVPVDRTVVKKRSASSEVESVAVPEVSVLTAKPWLTSEWREGLNEQQQEAFDLAHEWFFSQPDSPFVITGKPGSGKSYTVQRIVKSIEKIYRDQNDRGLKFALTAPTHRARAVLDGFAASAGVSAHIATMHSLMHLMPGKADHNGKTHLEVNTWSQEPHWSEFGLVCGDEQSMSSKELFKFIPSNIPAILMGDPRQLAPVENGEDSSSTLELSPVFSLPCGVNLTKVMRFDGELAYYVDAIADSIDNNDQFPPYISKFENRKGGNLMSIKSQDVWEREMIETFKMIDFTSQPNGARALAWTNKRVNELNNMIRFALTNVSPESTPYIEGDRVMAKEPIFRKEMTQWGEKNQTIMKTCDEGVVTAVYPDKLEYAGEVIKVNWLDITTDENLAVEVMTVHPESMPAVAAMIKDAKAKALAAEDKSEKKRHWRSFYEMLEVFNLVAKGAIMPRLQYAFASTVHQSQGGTYNYVFSDHQNMMMCREPATRSRLIYVASSRASDQLIAYAKY